MRDETYIQALSNTQKVFRTAATKFGNVEARIQQARERQDAEEYVRWQNLWQKGACDRHRIAAGLWHSLVLFERAGLKMPNRRWSAPAWVFREWDRVFDEEVE